jgi:hypothetical protein
MHFHLRDWFPIEISFSETGLSITGLDETFALAVKLSRLSPSRNLPDDISDDDGGFSVCEDTRFRQGLAHFQWNGYDIA